MSFKYNQTRCGVLMTPESLAPRFIELEGGLATNRAANGTKDRMSLTRDSHNRLKDTPKVDSSLKPRSVQGSLGVETRIRAFNPSESSEDLKARCPSHPNKRVQNSLIEIKYFLASNTNIGFCTKCAVTMSEREQLIQQEKLVKITELDKFKQQLAYTRQATNSKLKRLQMAESTIEQRYELELKELQDEFSNIVKALTDRYDGLAEQLKLKFEETRRQSGRHQQLLTATCQALQNYSTDINKNYEGILNDLSLANFEEIMQQYHRKLQQHKRQLESCEPSAIDFDSQLEMLDLKNMVGRMSLPSQHPAQEKKRPSLRARLENKQNNPHLANEIARKARVVR